jgi:hypothetical protein
MQNILRSFFIILILTTILFAGTIFEQYSVTPETNKVTITWRTTSEVNVASFIIRRSLDNNDYQEIGRISASGEASEYNYVDDNVYFKTTQTYFYKIRAVNSAGDQLEETDQALMANPNISGIFRTWGAIKSMFR